MPFTPIIAYELRGSQKSIHQTVWNVRATDKLLMFTLLLLSLLSHNSRNALFTTILMMMKWFLRRLWC